MDLQKENNLIQEAFEVDVDEIGFCFDKKWGDYENPYENSDTSLAFNLFKKGWQAAKAQAVPEGFVLVKKVHPDAIVHNQGLGLFKECQVIYGWDGKSKDFKEALNKGFYHGVKLGAKAVLETAMIEAQEPAND